MRRITAASTLLLAMTVPAATALADDGSAPLKIKGEPSKTVQLGFELPDDWAHDLPGASLNRGVYGRDLPAGAASCRVTVVTRGETSGAGIKRTRPRVRFRFDGGNVSFKAIERRGRWFRSGTAFDKAGNSWTATGAAELDVAEDAIIVLTRAYANPVAFNPDGTSRPTTDAEAAECAKAAPREIADGLRTILGSVVLERR